MGQFILAVKRQQTRVVTDKNVIASWRSFRQDRGTFVCSLLIRNAV